MQITILIVIVFAASLLWITFRIYTNFTFDDSLITYRYAENLALGKGFVFNPGERVLGTSTPLLTGMLGLLGAMIGTCHIPLISNVLMILASLGTGLLIYIILCRLQFSQHFSILGMAFFLFHPDMLWLSTGGLETPLVLLFMSGGLYGLVSKKQKSQ